MYTWRWEFPFWPRLLFTIRLRRFPIGAASEPTNEDAFGYSIEHGVYLVCDGMGGAAAGEIASSLAVDEVMRLLTDRPEGVRFEALMEQAISAANEVIYSRSQANPKLNGMGTTLVALVVEERRCQGAEHWRQPLLPVARRTSGADYRRITRWWMSRFGWAA